ncbi:recombinase family protein [Cellulomonas sp. P5_C5]
MATRTAIYTRISSDREGTELGITRQEEDTRALAGHLGFEVTHVFRENDRGASTRSRKDRPQYNAMIERARGGEFDAILAYSNSRLTRRPREHEDLIDLVDRHGVQIRTCVSGQFDLSTADGRAVARTIAAWDAAEAERTGERSQRAFRQVAESGGRHGQVPFGWQVEDGKQVIDPLAGSIVQEAARRLLGGETLRAITRDLNSRGSHPKRGAAWTGQQMRRVLLREANAGRRSYKGRVIADGQWPPLYDATTHDRVVALLTDPERKTTRGTDLKYLLTGIIRCGRPECGDAMRVHAGGTEGRAPAYVCPTCLRVRRKMVTVDNFVVETLLSRLSRPDAPNLFAGDADAMHAAEAEAVALRARLEHYAEQAADEVITDEQLAVLTKRLLPKVDAARARARAAAPNPELTRFIGPQAADAWEAEDRIDVRRALIRSVMDITLRPSGPGVPFHPEQVDITWKSPTVQLVA